MVRVKRRYLTIEIVPEDSKYDKKNKSFPLNERELTNVIKDHVHEIHGDYGVGSIQKSLYVKKFCPETRVAVITVQRGPHMFVTSSIPFIKTIKDIKCQIKLIYFSGTLRSSLKNLSKYYKTQSIKFTKILDEMKKEMKTNVDMEWILIVKTLYILWLIKQL